MHISEHKHGQNMKIRRILEMPGSLGLIKSMDQ